MYRKYYQNDELISSVVSAFALFVMFGIIFYFIYYDTGGWTPSSYLYVTFAGLSLLSSIYYLVVYLIGLNRDILDYEVDFEKEEVRFSRFRKFPFKSIKLYAIRENRSEIKLFFRFRLLNIITFQSKDDNNNPMSLEIAKDIGKYGRKINHRHLYNYNFYSMFIFMSMNLVFIFVSDSFPIIHQTYKYLIVLAITTGFMALLTFINNLRLTILYNNIIKKENEPKEIETSEEEKLNTTL